MIFVVKCMSSMQTSIVLQRYGYDNHLDRASASLHESKKVDEATKLDFDFLSIMRSLTVPL